MSAYTVEVRTGILTGGHQFHTWLQITKPDGTLADAGVQSINVGYTAQTVTDAQGNQILQAGQYTGADGLAHAVGDAWFSVDTARTVDLNPVAVDATIAALPDLAGFGNVHSLHQAMARDAGGRLGSCWAVNDAVFEARRATA